MGIFQRLQGHALAYFGICPDFNSRYYLGHLGEGDDSGDDDEETTPAELRSARSKTGRRRPVHFP
jgi:hypothetical protein